MSDRSGWRLAVWCGALGHPSTRPDTNDITQKYHLWKYKIERNI